MKFTVLIFILFSTLSVKSQGEIPEVYKPTIVTSAPIWNTVPIEATEPPDPKRINLVILSDGYTAGDITQKNNYLKQANYIAGKLQTTTPFKEYWNYFDVYIVFVPSAQAGVIHPCSVTAGSDVCPVPCTQTNPDTRFRSELDVNGLHRVIAADPALVNSFIASAFPEVTNCFKLILSNTKIYSGSANMENGYATLCGDPFLDLDEPDAPTNGSYYASIAIHELAHCFGLLRDEYFYNDHVAAKNKTNVDLGLATHEWAEWMGASIPSTTSTINHYLHAGIAVSTGTISTATESAIVTGSSTTLFQDELKLNSMLYRHPDGAFIGKVLSIEDQTHLTLTAPAEVIATSFQYKLLWWKPTPTSEQVCMMRNATMPFCRVCKEGLVERIHDLVNPIAAPTPEPHNDPDNTDPIEAHSGDIFDLGLILPNPNTLKVDWYINEQLVETNNTGVFSFDCSNPNFVIGNENMLKAVVFDNNYDGDAPYDENVLIRCTTHELHEYSVEWKIKFNGEIDLYTSDVAADVGVEPNPINEYMYLSPDIWVTNEGSTTPAEPEYSSDPDVRSSVHVKVHNRGCADYVDAAGDATMHVYWASASTSLIWPDSWDGTILVGGFPQGDDDIGSTDIPNVCAGCSTVVSLATWDVPNPANYGGNRHFCLYTRIESTDDPLTGEWTLPVEGLEAHQHNVRQFNNIAWKNVSVIVPEGGGFAPDGISNDRYVGGSVYLGNPSGDEEYFKLLLEVPALEVGKPITEQAEVRVILSDLIWARWVAGGQLGSNVTVYNAARKQVLLTSSTASLDNIRLEAGDNEAIFFSFNFLTEELTTKESFSLNVTQVVNSTDAVVGGENYHIKPDIARTPFAADAGTDKDVVLGDAYKVEMKNPLTEDAIYNWYDESGALVYTGAELNTTATTIGTSVFRLEVIAEDDGYKDYDEVTVTTVGGKITNVAPNPASSGTVVISYKVAGSVSSAHVKVYEVSTSTLVSSSTVSGTGSVNLSVSGLNTGAYSVVLDGDSEVLDTKPLIIQ